MKNCGNWLPEAIAIAGVAIGVGLALQGWPDWSNAMSQTWAAWVQAVGSVVAIGVAIWLRQRDVADTREQKRQEQLARMRALMAIIGPLPDWMKKRVTAFRETSDETEKAHLAEDIVRQANSVLRGIGEIPIHEAPYTFMATHLLNAKFCVDRYVHSFERLVPAQERALHVSVDSALAGADENVELMEKTLLEAKKDAEKFDGEMLLSEVRPGQSRESKG